MPWLTLTPHPHPNPNPNPNPNPTFKVEMQRQWSWEAAYAAGWFPVNVSHVGRAYLNICSSDPFPHTGAGAGAGGDLPWYNASPSMRGSSPVFYLMGLGLITLLGAAILLKVGPSALMRSSPSPLLHLSSSPSPSP